MSSLHLWYQPTYKPSFYNSMMLAKNYLTLHNRCHNMNKGHEILSVVFNSLHRQALFFRLFQMSKSERRQACGVSKERQTRAKGEDTEKVSSYFFRALPRRVCLVLLARSLHAWQCLRTPEKRQKIACYTGYITSSYTDWAKRPKWAEYVDDTNDKTILYWSHKLPISWRQYWITCSSKFRSIRHHRTKKKSLVLSVNVCKKVLIGDGSSPGNRTLARPPALQSSVLPTELLRPRLSRTACKWLSSQLVFSTV